MSGSNSTYHIRRTCRKINRDRLMKQILKIKYNFSFCVIDGFPAAHAWVLHMHGCHTCMSAASISFHPCRRPLSRRFLLTEQMCRVPGGSCFQSDNPNKTDKHTMIAV